MVGSEPCHNEDHDRLIRLEQKLDALNQLTSNQWVAHGRVHEAEAKAVEIAVAANRRLTAILFTVLGALVSVMAVVVAAIHR